MQLNIPAAPDNILGHISGLHSLPLGLQHRDLKCPSSGSVCLMFSRYCMARILLWLAYSWLEGS